MYMYIALRRFMHITLLLFRMTSRLPYSAQYHRHHCTLHPLEQLGALYMHNHDDKDPVRPGLEPGTFRLQPSEHEALTQCCFIVGPPSSTSAQH